jgi:hypothetical protein
LHGILGLGQGAQQPVGEIDQPAPFAHGRVQARAGPAVSSPRSGGHGASYSLGRICPHHFDKTARTQAAYGSPSAINRLLILNAELHPGRGTVLLLREAIGF